MTHAIPDDQIDRLLEKAKGHLFRVNYKGEISGETRASLWAHYNWIDRVAQAFCLGGLFLGIFLPRWAGRGHLTFWDSGVQFGIAILLPCLWCFMATISRSKRALLEFLFFYSLKYGIHWRGLFYFFYAPVIIFGVLAAIMVYGVR